MEAADRSTLKMAEQVLPEDPATWVHIHYIENDGSVWVMLESDIPVMDVIYESLNKYDDRKRLDNVVLEQIVSALNSDDTWYRARILSLKPDIRVQFIDFGDTAVVSAENIAPLPDSLSTIHPLAMKIELLPASKVIPTVGINLLVRPVEFKTNVTVVDVIGESEELNVKPRFGMSKAFCRNEMWSQTAVLLSKKEYTENSAEGLEIKTPDSNSTFLYKEASVLPSSVPIKKSFKDDKASVEFQDSLNSSAAEPEASLILSDAPQDASSESICSGNFSSDMLLSMRTDIEKLSQDAGVGAPTESFTAIVEGLSSEIVNAPPTRSNVSSDITHETDSSSLPSEPAELECAENKAGAFSDPSKYDGKFEPNAEYDSKAEAVGDVPAASPSAEFEPPFDSSKREIPSIVQIDNNSAISANDLENSDTSNLLMETNTSIAEIRKADGEKKMSKAKPADYEEKSDVTSFISALDHYPHLGGGYGPHSNESASPSDVGGSGDAQDKSCSVYSVSSLPKSTHGPTPITKGRNSKTSRAVLPQDLSSSSDYWLSKSSAVNTSFKAPPQQGSRCHAPQDFKKILEFELSIVREQNRLQMLQLQKKMEQNLSNQMKVMRDDTMKQLAAFRNEVNSRLSIIHDSVVHKLADIYSDIATLKNDQEITRETNGMKSASRETAVNSGPMHQFHSLPAQQRPPSRAADNPEMYQKYRDSSSQYSHEKESHNVMNTPTNRLMNARREKIMERDQNTHFQSTSKRQHNDRRTDDQADFSFGHFNSQNYPKVDYFDPSKTGMDIDTQSGANKGGSGNIICVNNLNAEKINPDLLYNLFGVYGNVLRVKLSLQDKGRAFIEMSDSAQAEEAIKYLNNVRLMGSPIHVSPCNFDQLKLSRQEFQSNTCKDFTKPQLQRLSRFKPGKWNPEKLFPPSPKLMIANVLSTVSDEKVKDVFAKKGFTVQSIFNQTCANDEKKIVFVTMSSVEEAVNALTVMHLQELSDWVQMRISFAKHFADK